MDHVLTYRLTCNIVDFDFSNERESWLCGPEILNQKFQAIKIDPEFVPADLTFQFSYHNSTARPVVIKTEHLQVTDSKSRPSKPIFNNSTIVVLSPWGHVVQKNIHFVQKKGAQNGNHQYMSLESFQEGKLVMRLDAVNPSNDLFKYWTNPLKKLLNQLIQIKEELEPNLEGSFELDTISSVAFTLQSLLSKNPRVRHAIVDLESGVLPVLKILTDGEDQIDFLKQAFDTLIETMSQLIRSIKLKKM